MAKDIRIKIKDAEKLIFSIEEDAHEGDYFDLNSVNKISLEEIKNILSNKENEYKNEIRQKEKQAWVNEFKNSSEYLDLINKNRDFATNIQIKEEERKTFDTQKKLELEKKQLELEKHYKNEYEIKIKDLEKCISERDASLKQYDNLKKLELEKKQLELEKEYKNAYELQIKDYENKIKDLNNNIDDIRRLQTSNSKSLGEGLEQWIMEQYNTYFACFGDTTLEKTTKDIKGTKPDFKFSILDTERNNIELTTVIIEAKTQLQTSKNKNKEHYEKLDNDRNNLHGEIALLVTELESENVFSIRKINDYKDMYEIRPAYLTIFLSLIRMMALTHKQIKELELNFKDKQKIMNEFDDMKNEILNNSIKHIETKTKDIRIQAEKISQCSKTIIEHTKIILEKHLETVENKLLNFKIKKIAEAIEKKDSNSQDQLLIKEKIIKE